MLAGMRTPLIAGNWKMHKLPSEAVTWARELLTALEGGRRGQAELVLNVPSTHIAPLFAALSEAPTNDAGGVTLGAQDLSAHDEGAYTGEVSGAMLRDAGAHYTIVGHSERREYHHEDDALVNAKVRAALRHGLRPILCVGETADQRDAGAAEDVVLTQLRAALRDVPEGAAGELVVAYEPVWAIGTGRNATAEDAQAMCSAVRAELARLYPEVGAGLRVLYGGSMNPGNAAELLARPDIDGGLVGGASLDVANLLAILEAAR